MRIIGGDKGGLRINISKKLKLRPTTDRSKEALFNILNNRIDFTDITVLDLFSGTGNISYEFSSRGSKKIISVDKNLKSINFINEFSKENDLKIYTILSNVNSYIKINSETFDIVFADPPYDFEDTKYFELINLIFNQNTLVKGGLFILEHSTKKSFNNQMFFIETRKYGDSSFSFFENIKN
tara:strand:- start:2614 stop:3159 length:546 start_codon:yes stop_codon:yes gene_type:complete